MRSVEAADIGASNQVKELIIRKGREARKEFSFKWANQMLLSNLERPDSEQAYFSRFPGARQTLDGTAIPVMERDLTVIGVHLRPSRAILCHATCCVDPDCSVSKSATRALIALRICSSLGYGDSNAGRKVMGTSSIRYTVPPVLMP